MTNRRFTSELLEQFPEIQHGFLSRDWGEKQAEGIPGKEVCQVKQVHGKSVVPVDDKWVLEDCLRQEADIMVSQRPNVALTIRTADCLPMLFFDPGKRAVAAAHAGWRGTVLGVANETIESLRSKFGCDPENIRVAIGPSIRQCCYEVDRSVYGAIKDKKVFREVPDKLNRWMLSLQILNERQLREAGILQDHIWVSDFCTVCRLDTFFSFRKEGEAAGRQWSFIALSHA